LLAHRGVGEQIQQLKPSICIKYVPCSLPVVFYISGAFFKMPDSKISTIEFKNFEEYLRNLNGPHDCPICNKAFWTLTTTQTIPDEKGDGERKVVPTIPGGASSKEDRRSGKLLYTRSMNILIMQCKNCGYMNFFNYNTVLKNINDNKFGSEDGESDEQK
ncbi:hypothetical protein, partial [Yersinia mollaretii]|uniref:hypothetical protein n=1 Tax=Yersinia mollaretii TaxID=33060 RepID=UPI0028674E29